MKNNKYILGTDAFDDKVFSVCLFDAENNAILINENIVKDTNKMRTPPTGPRAINNVKVLLCWALPMYIGISFNLFIYKALKRWGTFLRYKVYEV